MGGGCKGVPRCHGSSTDSHACSAHPPAVERGSISSDIRRGKGTKAENNCYCFPRLSSGPVSPAQCCCPATLAAVQWPRCARICADAGGDVVPVPRCLPPNHQSLVLANMERDGAGVVTPRTAALVLLRAPPASSGVPEMLTHMNIHLLPIYSPKHLTLSHTLSWSLN